MVLGEGPPVLMLGGFDGSFLDAAPLAVLLAQSHRVLIPDLYGFGFCPRPVDGLYSAEGVLRHLDALLDAPAYLACIQSPSGSSGSARVDVIGHSMGTRVVLDLVRRHPDRFQRIMLLAPSGLTLPPLPLPLHPLVEFFVVRFMSFPPGRNWLRRFMHAHADQTCTKGELEVCSVHLRTPGWRDSAVKFSRSGGFGRCDDPLPTQPILAILGMNDRLLSASMKQSARDYLGERLMDLPSCGHLPQWEHPEQVAAILNRWMEHAVPAG